MPAIIPPKFRNLPRLPNIENCDMYNHLSEGLSLVTKSRDYGPPPQLKLGCRPSRFGPKLGCKVGISARRRRKILAKLGCKVGISARRRRKILPKLGCKVGILAPQAKILAISQRIWSILSTFSLKKWDVEVEWSTQSGGGKVGFGRLKKK